jgi:hypothetical protein
MTTDITVIQEEVNKHLENKETVKTLVATTFKGLSEAIVPQAIVEGMLRGFTFRDFLEKNIYAVPFGSGYSLVTSIDYARKIGMRSGVIGKSAPKFEDSGAGDMACTITIKRLVSDHTGEFTATVFFKEYSTGKNLWLSKPRTMLAKVAEMHALRMACPEEASQIYITEELEKEGKAKPTADIEACKVKLEATKNLEELKEVWAALPVEAKSALNETKEILKKKFAK